MSVPVSWGAGVDGLCACACANIVANVIAVAAAVAAAAAVAIAAYATGHDRTPGHQDTHTHRRSTDGQRHTAQAQARTTI